MVSIVMTINKSQYQSLKYIGSIYISQSIFSHGQLYVALNLKTLDMFDIFLIII
jgi:hypothetical protein